MKKKGLLAIALIMAAILLCGCGGESAKDKLQRETNRLQQQLQKNKQDAQKLQKDMQDLSNLLNQMKNGK